MRRLLPVLFVLLCAAPRAQVPAFPLQFEAASIKLNPMQPPYWLRDFPAGLMPGAIAVRPGGRIEGRVVELRYLVFWAYGLDTYQTVEGKQPLLSEHFDINAKAENPNASREDLQKMLRSLLVERFHLQARVDTSDGDALVMQPARGDGKPGPGLTSFTDDCEIRNQNRAAFGSPQWKAGPPCRWTPMNGYVHAAGLSMPQFAKMVALYMDMPVHDQTGWPGEYELHVQVNLNETPGLQKVMPLGARLGAPAASQSDSPAFVDALRDQLGIRLVKSRGPIDTVVVDRVDPLIEN